MNTTKTLIILTPGFPANEADSTCIPFLQLFVKSCKENNPWLKIVVLSFQYPFKPGIYSWHGLTINSFNGRNKGNINRWIVWFKVWKAMKLITREQEVLGVLSFWLGECAFIGTHFCRRNQLKHFTWILGQDAKKQNRYHQFINPDAKSLIALSDFVAREYWSNYGIQPKQVVPIGLDTTLFSKEQPVRDIDVMGAGSLIPLKRYDLFIKVIEELVKYLPDITTVICGKGPEKERLSKQVKKAGLQYNIILLDELPHREVIRLMQRSKVFFHPSSYEGYGAVCAEALYAGSHVVSFCKPMDKFNQQHHIVQTKEESVYRLLDILQDEKRTHHKILDYSVEDISKRMMDLFLV